MAVLDVRTQLTLCDGQGVKIHLLNAVVQYRHRRFLRCVLSDEKDHAFAWLFSHPLLVRPLVPPPAG